MLNLEQKIEYFKNCLENKNDNYADIMKNEIYFYFFENERNFNFLNNLNLKEEIENKIEFVVSNMILNEHQDGIENIISYQFYG